MRGPEVYPDGASGRMSGWTGRPYAMMIEDILIKISGTMRWRRGSSAVLPPFPTCGPISLFQCGDGGDLAGSHGGEEYGIGRLFAAGAGGGADALLVIRKMREELRLLSENADRTGACGHRCASRLASASLCRKPLDF